MAQQTGVVRVGSRKSQLALIQTNSVIDKLKKLHPYKQFELVTMSTVGDQILDTPLSKIGEKSLFTKELEHSLVHKEVDFVVHSLKDLPTLLPDGLCIGAVCMRDSPYDAVVMRKDLPYKSLEELPEGSVIGTSSLRRIAQLKQNFPNFKFKDIRGNLNTRLKKLDDAQDYAAIVLAEAGLTRMKWDHRITQVLNDQMYAVSQGAMAVECRTDDVRTLTLLSSLNDTPTVMAVVAERAYLTRLEGGCSVPIGTFCTIENNTLKLKGGVYTTDGSQAVIEEIESSLPTVHDDLMKANATDSPAADTIGAATTNADDAASTDKPEASYCNEQDDDCVDQPPRKKARRTSCSSQSSDSQQCQAGSASSAGYPLFSSFCAMVPPECLYGTMLAHCEKVGRTLADRMLSAGADEILRVTKQICADEQKKRREQLIAKRQKLGLKEGDIPAECQKQQATV